MSDTLSENMNTLTRVLLVTLTFIVLALLAQKETNDQIKLEQQQEKEIKAREIKIEELEQEKNNLKKELDEAKAQALLKSSRPNPIQLLGTCDYRITTARGYSLTDETLVVQEINSVFGTNANLARAIFTSESGLRSNACSPTNDWGVCQVNRTAHKQYSIEFLMNYKNNIQACWVISNGGTNWNPWSDFKNGNYLRYL